jgi:hypothetical protein
VFDPTIFENIKVALEGAVYDLDFAGEIAVISRSDRVDLAVMSREYTLEFQDRKQKEDKKITAVLTLAAGPGDLAGEILELPETEERKFGCALRVMFLMDMDEIAHCANIEATLDDIWSYRPRITQELSFVYHLFSERSPSVYRNTVSLDFGRKINEDNIDDLFNIVEHAVYSLRELSNYI